MQISHIPITLTILALVNGCPSVSRPLVPHVSTRRRSLTLVDIWRQHGEHTTDVSLQTQRLTLDVVGLVAFNHDFGETEQIRRCALDAAPGRTLTSSAAQHHGSTLSHAGMRRSSVRHCWGLYEVLFWSNWHRELAGAQTEKEDALLWAVNTFGEILAKVNQVRLAVPAQERSRPGLHTPPRPVSCARHLIGRCHQCQVLLVAASCRRTLQQSGWSSPSLSQPMNVPVLFHTARPHVQVFITPLPMLRFMERLGDPTLRTLTRAVDTLRGSMLDVIHVRCWPPVC